MRKGASEIISTILMVLVSTVSVGVVLMIGMPAINRAKEAGITNEAGKNIQALDDTIREVASEGTGSLRTPRLQISDGDYRIFNYSGNNTGAIEFRYSMNYNSFPLLGVRVDENVKTSTGVSTRGLIGYWRLNEINSTNYTLDNSGKGNDGQVITGGEDVFSKQVSEKYGNGLQFDGVDDYVDAGNGTSLQISGNFSISAWIKLASWTMPDFAGIAEQYNADNKGFLLDKYGANTDLRFVLNPGTGEVSKTFGLSWSTDTWYHVAVTVDGSNIKLYRDGIFIVSQSAGTMNASTQKVYIGRGYASSAIFNGTIDEVKIYNRALTADEIQEDFAAKQSDFRMTIEYDKIDIMGVAKFGKGNQKVCIEKTGSEGNKAIVSVSVC
jgi:hypothetical protein